ncbi:MAG: hypothetical protein LUD78_03305 [Clostridiales bacterium]|nr:hypothetical protein [Clostridiales bacterium]
MKTYINDLLANLEEARDELQQRVADGECESLVACMEKINEILTAVRYWEYVTENGGLEMCEGAAAYFDTLFMNTIAENLAEATASALMYVEATDWKDQRATDALCYLDEVNNTTSALMEQEE